LLLHLAAAAACSMEEKTAAAVAEQKTPAVAVPAEVGCGNACLAGHGRAE